MKIETLNSVEQFASLESEWDALLKQDILSNNFLSFQWAYSWWRAYRPDASLNIITVRNDSHDLVGIAPLMKRHFRDIGFRYTSLSFIGDGTDETDHMSFVLHKDYLKDTVDAILLSIMRDDDWDLLDLNMIQTKAMLKKVLERWASKNRFFFIRKDVQYAESHLPDSFEEFMSNLQPRLRTKLRSSRRKLSKNFDVEFGIHTPENQATDLEALFKNHASRWKAKGESGTFLKDARRLEFYRLLTHHFFKKDWLRFFYLKLDGEIAAQQYCFEYEGCIYLLQEGFDYSFAKYNIGNVLRSYVFEYCINHKKKTYDFLLYLSQHKLKWANHVSEDRCIKIFRRKFKNRLYHYKRIYARKVKGFIKKMLPESVIYRLKEFMR